MHLVCLTFDFDAFSPKLHGGATDPVVLSQGEFSALGATRLLELFSRRRIPTTWFTPGHTLETFPELAARVHAEGHEIAHHGYLHETPSSMTRAEEFAVLQRGSECIRRITGASPSGYRAPGSELSPSTLELLVEFGIGYDSSLAAEDSKPYLVTLGSAYPKDGPPRPGTASALIELPVHAARGDFALFEFVRRPGFNAQGLTATTDVLANWLEEFAYLRRSTQSGVLTYVMHPEVIGRGHRMLMLERLIAGLEEMGARFVRMDTAMGQAREWLRDGATAR